MGNERWMDSRDISKAKSTGLVGQLELHNRHEGSIQGPVIQNQLAWMGPWNLHFDKHSNPSASAEDGSPAIIYKILGRL